MKMMRLLRQENRTVRTLLKNMVRTLLRKMVKTLLKKMVRTLLKKMVATLLKKMLTTRMTMQMKDHLNFETSLSDLIHREVYKYNVN